MVDFNVKSADQSTPISQLEEGTPDDTVTFHDEVPPLPDDEIDKILKSMMDDIDQPVPCAALPQV